jgi:predicted DNA-binding antitoxin AbrB/MazE fold protein
MEMKTIHAVYEHGVFRPLETVDLAEQTQVEFEPRPIQTGDGEAANIDGVYSVLSKRYKSGEHDVAERHNEHQS